MRDFGVVQGKYVQSWAKENIILGGSRKILLRNAHTKKTNRETVVGGEASNRPHAATKPCAGLPHLYLREFSAQHLEPFPLLSRES